MVLVLKRHHIRPVLVENLQILMAANTKITAAGKKHLPLLEFAKFQMVFQSTVLILERGPVQIMENGAHGMLLMEPAGSVAEIVLVIQS